MSILESTPCMNVPYSSPKVEFVDRPCIKIGVLAPLSKPGWTDAGRHLVAGLTLATEETNNAGGIDGAPIELIIKDTAADAQKAIAAVDELLGLGVVCLTGEYHSVVARAVAIKSDDIQLPYICSSAVLDELTEQPTDWVARLAPAQSHCWRIYADFLLEKGHTDIAIAIDPTSIYWQSGSRILRERLTLHGGSAIELNVRTLTPAALCDELVQRGNQATALILLLGLPEPTISIVKAVRSDQQLATIMLGAPAGQPEFAELHRLLGVHSAAIPFLRYMPEKLSPLGSLVEVGLRERLTEEPSFVAFEGYDTILVLANILRSFGTHQASIASSWPHISVQGTRGHIQFSRIPGISAWQWAWPPVQVVDRNPMKPENLRVLYVA